MGELWTSVLMRTAMLGLLVRYAAASGSASLGASNYGRRTAELSHQVRYIICGNSRQPLSLHSSTSLNPKESTISHLATWGEVVRLHLTTSAACRCLAMMMMSFICSCRNNNHHQACCSVSLSCTQIGHVKGISFRCK